MPPKPNNRRRGQRRKGTERFSKDGSMYAHTRPLTRLSSVGTNKRSERDRRKKDVDYYIII